MQRTSWRYVLSDANALAWQVEPGRRIGPQCSWSLGAWVMSSFISALKPVSMIWPRSTPMAAGTTSWSRRMAPTAPRTMVISLAASATVKGGARRVTPTQSARGPYGVVATRGRGIRRTVTNIITQVTHQIIPPPAVGCAEILSRTTSKPITTPSMITIEEFVSDASP